MPANIRNDLDLLIDRNLNLCPDDPRQVANERLVMVGLKHRMEIASVRL